MIYLQTAEYQILTIKTIKKVPEYVVRASHADHLPTIEVFFRLPYQPHLSARLARVGSLVTVESKKQNQTR